MPVYIEIVIFNNLVVDTALVLLTVKSLKLNSKAWQQLISIILGVGIAVAYPLAPKALQIVMSIFLPIVMSAIFAKYKNFKNYILALLVFGACTYFLGGLTMFLLKIFGIDLASNWISGVVVLALLIVCYVVRQIVLHKKINSNKNLIKKAKMVMYGEEVKINALYDSGNQLIDKMTGYPVVVLSNKVGKKWETKSKRKITVKTVGGTIDLPVLEGKDLKIGNNKNQFSTKEFLIAIANENYNGFDLILHESMNT